MKLLTLGLTNFRNHKKFSAELAEKTIVVGQNGVGKSNLLEAIYLAATAKSFRASSDHEMIRYGEKVGRVKLTMVRSGEKIDLEIVIHDGTLEGIKKKFFVNGVAKRSTDFGGNLKAVMFSPVDMELLSGSPSGRRKYLDLIISQSDREYRRSLISYEKGLRQRNRLLEQIREGEAERSQLFFWDRLLIKNGNYLTDKRAELLNFFSGQGTEGEMIFKCGYDRSEISEARLKQYETEEVMAATTLVGPHRDDFVVEMQDADQENNFVNVAKFGSRGEQRMAVLWLKGGEFNYLNQADDCPVLLLDDIFSELDHKHREVIETLADAVINKGGQVIMTTADEHVVPKQEWKIINL
jgi:DNA replication and repair protein RecF